MYGYRLTEDAQQLLHRMQERYLLARAEGADDIRARIMPDDVEIQSQWFPNLSVTHVNDLCQELEKADLLTIRFSSGTFYDCTLTTEGISYKESPEANPDQQKEHDQLKEKRHVLPLDWWQSLSTGDKIAFGSLILTAAGVIVALIAL